MLGHGLSSFQPGKCVERYFNLLFKADFVDEAENDPIKPIDVLTLTFSVNQCVQTEHLKQIVIQSYTLGYTGVAQSGFKLSGNAW